MSSALISATRPERLEETAEQRAERLAHEGAPSDRLLRLQQLEAKIYADVTFQPHIDPISRALGRPSGVDVLVEVGL